MDDLIERQAAIDAVETKIKKWNAVDGEGCHVGLGLRYTDVIDTLTELPSAQPYTEDELQKMQDLEQAELDKAYDLGRQSAQPEPQWIPCSERLPEAETMYFRPKHRYLCQRKNEMFVGARFCEPNGMLKEWWDWYGTKIRDEDVTAWMPLPEPYKGEQE